MSSEFANHVGFVSANLIWEAERKLRITVDYRGRNYQQEVIASSANGALLKARAAIAERNFDAAMDGAYSVEILPS
jgi:hypothetical protein